MILKEIAFEIKSAQTVATDVVMLLTWAEMAFGHLKNRPGMGEFFGYILDNQGYVLQIAREALFST